MSYGSGVVGTAPDLPFGGVMNETIGVDVPEVLRTEFAKLVFKAKAEGRKTSEGDGRTAADIKRELEEAKKEEPADAAQ